MTCSETHTQLGEALAGALGRPARPYTFYPGTARPVYLPGDITLQWHCVQTRCAGTSPSDQNSTTCMELKWLSLHLMHRSVIMGC